MVLSSGLTLIVCVLISFACEPNSDVSAEAVESGGAWKDVKRAVAVMIPTEGSDVHGVVHFDELEGGKVKVMARIEGLEPNSKHGFHVHQWGDLSAPDGTATGGHYNPQGHEHGLPTKDMRHAGDLGNLEANAEGVATYEMTFDNFTIAGMKNPVVGRGMIIHAKQDDGGQPTGNAGARVAQGVIGISGPETAAAK